MLKSTDSDCHRFDATDTVRLDLIFARVGRMCSVLIQCTTSQPAQKILVSLLSLLVPYVELAVLQRCIASTTMITKPVSIV